MANVLVQESSLTAIADAIRAKNGTEDTYKPADMASAIAAIETSSGYSKIGYFSVKNTTGYATNKITCPDVITSTDQIYALTVDTTGVGLFNMPSALAHPLVISTTKEPSIVLADGTVAVDETEFSLTLTDNSLAITSGSGTAEKIIGSSRTAYVVYGYNEE